MPSKLTRAAIFAALSSGCYTSNPPPEGPPPPPPPPHDQQVTNEQTFADPPPPPPPPPATAANGSVAGTVTASDGSGPMNHLPITLTGPNGTQRSTNTDANGRYVFDRLAPGSYTLTFGYSNHPRRRPPQQGVIVKQDAAATVNFTYYIAPPSNVPMPYGAPPARRRVV